MLLLPRELVVFALELGQPAASSPLPPGLPVLSHLLGVYGKGFCQGVGDQGGLDFAYCVHVDGSLSVWIRVGTIVCCTTSTSIVGKVYWDNCMHCLAVQSMLG